MTPAQRILAHAHVHEDARLPLEKRHRARNLIILSSVCASTIFQVLRQNGRNTPLGLETGRALMGARLGTIPVIQFPFRDREAYCRRDYETALD